MIASDTKFLSELQKLILNPPKIHSEEDLKIGEIPISSKRKLPAKFNENSHYLESYSAVLRRMVLKITSFCSDTDRYTAVTSREHLKRQ